MGIGAIPAYYRFVNQELFLGSCSYVIDPGLGTSSIQSPLLLHPNPADDRVFLNYDGTLLIFDIHGKIVFNETIEQGTIDISHLDPGIYFVNCLSESNQKATRLVIY